MLFLGESTQELRDKIEHIGVREENDDYCGYSLTVVTMVRSKYITE
jgi:hypothetical protein